MNEQSQLLKGVLESCILKIIYHKSETYGYEIVSELRTYGFGQCTEGTIYPLLTRLEKKGLVSSDKRPSPQGPQRKYYAITSDGMLELTHFEETWREFKSFVDQLFKHYEVR